MTYLSRFGMLVSSLQASHKIRFPDLDSRGNKSFPRFLLPPLYCQVFQINMIILRSVLKISVIKASMHVFCLPPERGMLLDAAVGKRFSAANSQRTLMMMLEACHVGYQHFHPLKHKGGCCLWLIISTICEKTFGWFHFISH